VDGDAGNDELTCVKHETIF